MPQLRLVAADQVAGAVHVHDPQEGRPIASLTGRHLSEHAGFLRLRGGRVAFVDDLAGALVVLDPFAGEGRPAVPVTVPVAVPGEHLAADPTGRFLAVSTGCGRSPEPWSDLLTVVDLAAAPQPRAVRVRTRTGEPGVAVLGPADDPLMVVRERMPGALAVHRLTGLLAAGPGCPAVEPSTRLPLPDDGHGDAADPATGRVFTATEDGVAVAVRDGRTLTAGPSLAWHGDGDGREGGREGGRGYFLRLDPARRTLWSTVRGGPPEPDQWPRWTNHAWWHRIDEGRTGRLDLGPGLVFRLALSRTRAAFTRIHPSGDELVLVDRDTTGPHGPRVRARLPLPPMDGAPREGCTPWDGVQRRAVAASPAADPVAVSRGGHGEIHLYDASCGAFLRTVTTPTPLDEGGHLALVAKDDGAEGDTIGR
ncbi:hypothetical protein [Streptomyces sp. HB2AG]|uniref:hypothetical protein n=1 Tax=Streptomyces sp. HB2AG TaxID=2983400 RepID=UPI0022AAE4C7|nr:hypothetical protein [Streptomyces sp. HB2AG]MCZ2527086.1 hypothetical protein [Streptomyces sp. HB2AG]